MDQYKMSWTQWINTIGIAVAAIISWTTHKSITWAIIHAACAWFYIAYYAITN